MNEDIKILREALAAHAQWCEEDGEIGNVSLFNKAQHAYRAACDPDRVRRILDDAERYQWQPIETAPRNGTYVVVWPPTFGGATSCARWCDDKYAKRPRPYWSRLDDMGRVSTSRDKPPTHWMPQLAAPKEST